MSELNQTIFFYAFLLILLTAAVFTFFGLAGKVPNLSSRNLSIMLTSVVLAVVGSVVVYFKALFDESNSELTNKVLIIGRHSTEATISSTPVQIMDVIEKRLTDLGKREKDFEAYGELKAKQAELKAKLKETLEELEALRNHAIPVEKLPKEFKTTNTFDSLQAMSAFLESSKNKIPSPDLIPKYDLEEILEAIGRHHAESLSTLLDIQKRISGFISKVKPEQGIVQRLTMDSNWAENQVQYTKNFLPFCNTPGHRIALRYKEPDSDVERTVDDLVLAEPRDSAPSLGSDYLMVHTSVMQRLLPPDKDATRVGELKNVKFFIIPPDDKQAAPR